MVFFINMYSFMGAGLGLLGLLFFFYSMIMVCFKSSFFLEWVFFGLSGGEISFSLFFDWMGCLFLSIVMFISMGVTYYCNYYMEGDLNGSRFIFLLFLFVSSMFFLVISPNMVSILLGWDGLGLSSYLLVIYYQNYSSYSSGMLTVLSNRVGDVMILLFIGLTSGQGGWNVLFFSFLDEVECFLLVVASMTKSAQLPFSAWLPAAMAAPTPVSSLVHSSTLVTAGVFLLVRFYDSLACSFFLGLLFYGGVATMLVSSLSANFEMDVKKIIAFSTLSQLGLMFMIIGHGWPLLAFFHLLCHALFKSTLFMCGGFVIHSINSSQDCRQASGFFFSSPFLSVCFVVTNLALCGFPFMSGFFSKDLIVEGALYSQSDFFFVCLVFICLGMTVSYSFRFLYYTFSCSSSWCIMSAGDADKYVFFGCSFLVLMSGLGGFLLYWVYFWGFDFFLVDGINKYLIFLVGFFSGAGMYYTLMSSSFKVGAFYWMAGRMFFLSLLSSGLNSFFLKLFGFLLKAIDFGWLEFQAGLSGKPSAWFLFSKLQSSQRGFLVYMYLFFFLFFMFMVVF